MKHFAVLILLTLAASLPLVGQAAPAPDLPPDLPKGKVIENITCAGAPDQQYALYLPSGYRPDRTWPILYVMDARGQAPQAAEVFRAGAERYGWILASSYNTASDTAVDPNPAALRAMWTDTHSRLAIDGRRVYLAGYSGTVRAGINLALAAPEAVTGIFGASAGFPFEREPTRDVPFDFFGTAGTRDYNFYEMLELDKKLAALALPFRIETFDGLHAWPPPELASRGIGWFELQAMRRGLRARDAGLIDELWALDLEEARKAEGAGRMADAFHTWSAMRSSYAGLRDTAEAERKAAEIGASEAFRKATVAREARKKREQDYIAEAQRILGRALQGGSEIPATPARLASELKIAEWQKRAASSDVEESQAAARVLGALSGQTGAYLPRMYIDRKDWDSALLMLGVAAEIRPNSPGIWLSIASVHARKGKRGHKPALDALEKAVALGLTGRAQIDGAPAFDELRQDKRFRSILEKMTKTAAAPPEGTGG